MTVPVKPELIELIARKLAAESGFDPDEMMVHQYPFLVCGSNQVVSTKNALPSWRNFEKIAISMINVARALSDNECNALVGYRYA
jgi:hypothetical protein